MRAVPGDRLLLMDSDAFLVLAGAGVLDHAIAALGYDTTQVCRLDALPHMIARRRRLKRNYPPGALAAKATTARRLWVSAANGRRGLGWWDLLEANAPWNAGIEIIEGTGDAHR